ncbi:hypothetical protein QVD17_38327 [Tagetes erecta]|uniref:Uncharacterized protein n=1 Tax=Tagetes erecta TaxID=13708 RepID=A0AAD8JLN6_TARER|nr:hypothetical protein QVD17_38327 [Tagetes erecta]
MVCQSAGQTRFRALKHLNGTAGSATIIVKVIACFQPLQDCQAEYFPVDYLLVFFYKNLYTIIRHLVTEWIRLIILGPKTRKWIVNH